MSRKDARRALMVPLTAQERAVFRPCIFRSSLADALRRALEVQIAAGVQDHGMSPPERTHAVALQLPKQLRWTITRLAREWGRPEGYVVRQAISQIVKGPQDSEGSAG